jgi:16S rRNA (guanine527-N7)-methyltransferase
VRAPEQTPVWFRDLLNRELLRWVRLSDIQIAQLYRHYELLVRWNERMNLTSVKPGPEMVIRHYCESLFFAAHLPEQREEVVILDIGSGAGFPGVPLAVLKPAWHVALVESVQKKAVFLRESCRHLQNVSVQAQRMEDLAQRGDWAVSRAVDPLEILGNLPRLATSVGLMLSEDDLSSLRDTKFIAWSPPVRLPWGDRKLCVFGSST